MSDDRVRLRLAGEPAADALPILDDPPALPGAIAIVGAHAGIDVEPMVRALRDALGAPVTRVSLRTREGSEVIEGDETIVRASSSAIDATLAALPGAGRIVVGAAFVALRRPRLAILITGGASPVQWDPTIRALRERFDLVLEDPRASLARELARQLGGSGLEV